MDVLEHLIAARGYIAFPGGFCQGELLRRLPTGTLQVCSLGALIEVKDRSSVLAYDSHMGAVDALASAIEALDSALPSGWPRTPFNTVIYYNNTHTQAEVVAVFDTAIETERAKRRDLVGLLCTPALPLAIELEPAPCL